MPSIQKLARGKFLIASNTHQLPLSQEWFSPEYWSNKNAVSGKSQGRSTTYFIDNDNFKFVLRHYYRGGMVRHFMRDTYLYSGLKSTRIYAELKILEQLALWNLPAPTPIGGYLERKGLLYRADLLMNQIPNASDLFHYLQTYRLDNKQWQNIGSTIGEFHQHGVYHADLNCHNIMRDNCGKIWIIDFDRAKLQTDTANTASWTSQNLGRLYRSFNKEKNRCSQFYFDEQCWEQLLIGYDGVK